jgi:hypothetical protein
MVLSCKPMQGSKIRKLMVTFNRSTRLFGTGRTFELATLIAADLSKGTVDSRWAASNARPLSLTRKSEKKPPGRDAGRLSHATAGPALLRFRRICRQN